MEHFFVYSDGGSRGNPGPAAYGFVIYNNKKEKIAEGLKFLGTLTNNQAEYHGILAALSAVKQLMANSQQPIVECFLDSQLIVEQMNGRYKIKNEGLKPLFWKIRELILELGGNVSFKHIPREENKEADKLANEAIDKGIK
ncbi:hypothetical protein A3F08_01110 [Candidatus Berkelbacteria bacterium RIFCSPHIGHO2_12_FULL_36_9]|uniref:RNase H type-1 domain-containing protein n=1 Tax=Candidatus Berkelbacteria bacterium RIFCSPHIGHO2_12_FULL_36_9 TaxID=1797469 RepID=A0A1F5EEJ3_9BACT|nr:MAG: hypothetical protein A3F08_01110 [Candidatus Berkelbacteria bacterium RIFCSPHIGHO2_12_FULL_36_9]